MPDSGSTDEKIIPPEYKGVFSEPWSFAKLLRVLSVFGPGAMWSRRRVQITVSIYVLVSSSLVVWSDLRFDTLTHVVAFLTTNLAVALSMVAAVYLNFRLPQAYRTRWWMLLGGVLAAVVLLIVSAVSGAGVWDELRAALTGPP